MIAEGSRFKVQGSRFKVSSLILNLEPETLNLEPKTKYMFCTKCGANNSDEAVYCQKCGTLLEAEEETRIARPISNKSNGEEDETQIFTIRPTLLFVKAGYGLAVLGAFLLVFLFSFTSLSAWYSVIAGLSLLLIPAYFHLKQKLVRYTLTDAKIEIDSG